MNKLYQNNNNNIQFERVYYMNVTIRFSLVAFYAYIIVLRYATLLFMSEMYRIVSYLVKFIVNTIKTT